jgi:Arc/MetJ family transcription regulator
VAKTSVYLPDDLAATAKALGIVPSQVARAAVTEAVEEAVRRAGAGRRLVTVTAVVMAGDSDYDVTESYAAVITALRDLVKRRHRGQVRTLVPIGYPLARFEARSEPVTGEAP